MSGYLIDLFSSFKGRISRTEWRLATLALVVIGVGGVLLFNDDGFDESANKVADVPTMAAFLWALLCLFAFTALCAKRLNDCDRPPRLAYAVSIAGSLTIVGWGLGFFLTPLAVSIETLIFWVLIALTLPAILACAALPAKGGD